MTSTPSGVPSPKTTEVMVILTARNPQTLEQFFRENARFFSGTNQEA